MSDEENSLTVRVLIEIRDEARKTNERLDRTNERLDSVVQQEIRHATAITALQAGQTELVRGQAQLIDGMARLIDTVVSIDRRTSALERGQEAILAEVRTINARIDNVFTGPLGSEVRDNVRRIEALEQRMEAFERRTG